MRRTSRITFSTVRPPERALFHMRYVLLAAAAAALTAGPAAAQGRWSLESGGSVAHVNDVNAWAGAGDMRVGFDVSSRTRVTFGLARWFDASRTNGQYSWGGLGAELGAAVLVAGDRRLGVRATGIAHASVGNDGDGTPRVHVGPSLGLQLEAGVAGPLRFFVGGAGHLFVVTDGRVDPGANGRAGLAVQL